MFENIASAIGHVTSDMALKHMMIELNVLHWVEFDFK